MQSTSRTQLDKSTWCCVLKNVISIRVTRHIPCTSGHTIGTMETSSVFDVHSTPAILRALCTSIWDLVIQKNWQGFCLLVHFLYASLLISFPEWVYCLLTLRGNLWMDYLSSCFLVDHNTCWVLDMLTKWMPYPHCVLAQAEYLGNIVD
jgi:hypothetical protein